MRAKAHEIVEDLARLHGLMHEDSDEVNRSAFARRTGLDHATISRIMRGKVETMNTRTVQALIDAFKITFGQARGDVPIRRKARPSQPTEAEMGLIRDLRELDATSRGEVETLIRLKRVISKHERR